MSDNPAGLTTTVVSIAGEADWPPFTILIGVAAMEDDEEDEDGDVRSMLLSFTAHVFGANAAQAENVACQLVKEICEKEQIPWQFIMPMSAFAGHHPAINDTPGETIYNEEALGLSGVFDIDVEDGD